MALPPEVAASVQRAVRERIGGEDDVLPEYVMVMVQNGKTERDVARELEAFMGASSSEFAEWLWDKMAEATTGISSTPIAATAGIEPMQPVPSSRGVELAQPRSTTQQLQPARHAFKQVVSSLKQQLEDDRQQREADWAKWEAETEMRRMAQRSHRNRRTTPPASDAAILYPRPLKGT